MSRMQVDTVPARLTEPEVEELWHFVHGDIMQGGIRAHLRRSMGLCPRHTWAYAQVEIELWQQGAGSRGGHQPFDVCVLYDDLLGEAVRRLTTVHLPWHRSPAWALRAMGPCWVCSSLQHDDLHAVPGGRGFAGSNTAALTAEANLGRHTLAWLDRTHGQWAGRVCPLCAQQLEYAIPTAGHGPGIACRPHLELVDSFDASARDSLVDELLRLQQGVQRLAGSITARGPSSTRQADASWVETLAWFTGWAGLLGPRD